MDATSCAPPGGLSFGPLKDEPKLIELEKSDTNLSGYAGVLTPSLPRRSGGRPKHVFYSSTAYTVHSPV